MEGSHGGQTASRWVQRWSHLVLPGARVLDLACGSGRHVRWFAQRGCHVTGVDRDADAVAPLSEIATIVVADLERGPWPFAGTAFEAVVVTNYLWRERLADLLAAVAPGGLLIYETFAVGNETIGKPSNPKFLLRSGELLAVLAAEAGWRVVAFEDGFEEGFSDGTGEGFEAPPDRFVQRIVAVREASSQTPAPPRYPLLPASSSARLKSADSEDPP